MTATGSARQPGILVAGVGMAAHQAACDLAGQVAGYADVLGQPARWRVASATWTMEYERTATPDAPLGGIHIVMPTVPLDGVLSTDERALLPGFDEDHYARHYERHYRARPAPRHNGTQAILDALYERQPLRRAFLHLLTRPPQPMRTRLQAIIADSVPVKRMYILAALDDPLTQATLLDIVHESVRQVDAAQPEQPKPQAFLYLMLPSATAPAAVRAGAFALLRELNGVLLRDDHPRRLYAAGQVGSPLDLARRIDLVHVYPHSPQIAAVWADVLYGQIVGGSLFDQDYFAHHVINWEANTANLYAQLAIDPDHNAFIPNLILPRCVVLPAAHLRAAEAQAVAQSALDAVLHRDQNHAADWDEYKAWWRQGNLWHEASVERDPVLARASADEIDSLLFNPPDASVEGERARSRPVTGWRVPPADSLRTPGDLATRIIAPLASLYGYDPLHTGRCDQQDAKALDGLATMLAQACAARTLAFIRRGLAIDSAHAAYPLRVRDALHSASEQMRQIAEAASRYAQNSQTTHAQAESDVYMGHSRVQVVRNAVGRLMPEVNALCRAAEIYAETCRRTARLSALAQVAAATAHLLNQHHARLNAALMQIERLHVDDQKMMQAGVMPADHRLLLTDGVVYAAYSTFRDTSIDHLAGRLHWKLTDDEHPILVLTDDDGTAQHPDSDRLRAAALALVDSQPPMLNGALRTRRAAVTGHLAALHYDDFPTWAMQLDLLTTPPTGADSELYSIVKDMLPDLNAGRWEGRPVVWDEATDPYRVQRTTVLIGGIDRLPGYAAMRAAYDDAALMTDARARLHVLPAEQSAARWEERLSAGRRDGAGDRAHYLPLPVVALLDADPHLELFVLLCAGRFIDLHRAESPAHWHNYAITLYENTSPGLIWLTEARNPVTLLNAAIAFYFYAAQPRLYDDPVNEKRMVVPHDTLRQTLSDHIRAQMGQAEAAGTGPHWLHARRVRYNPDDALFIAAQIDLLRAYASRTGQHTDLFTRFTGLLAGKQADDLAYDLTRNFIT